MKIILLSLLLINLNACGTTTKKSSPNLVTEQKAEELKSEIAAEPQGQITQGLGYEITYPLGWDLTPDFMGTDTMALSQLSSDSDVFRENINVVVEPVKITGGTQTYYELNLPAMKTGLKNFSVVSETKLQLKDGLAIDVIYLHEMGSIKAKNRVIFLYHNDVGYVITATSSPETFEEYYGTFDKIIKSFKFQ